MSNTKTGRLIAAILGSSAIMAWAAAPGLASARETAASDAAASEGYLSPPPPRYSNPGRNLFWVERDKDGKRYGHVRFPGGGPREKNRITRPPRAGDADAAAVPACGSYVIPWTYNGSPLNWGGSGGQVTVYYWIPQSRSELPSAIAGDPAASSANFVPITDANLKASIDDAAARLNAGPAGARIRLVKATSWTGAKFFAFRTNYNWGSSIWAYTQNRFGIPGNTVQYSWAEFVASRTPVGASYAAGTVLNTLVKHEDMIHGWLLFQDDPDGYFTNIAGTTGDTAGTSIGWSNTNRDLEPDDVTQASNTDSCDNSVALGRVHY